MDPTGDYSEVWTEVERLILRSAERASTCPRDTRAKPYLVRIRGMAVRPVVGDQVEIRTVTDRHLVGRVRELEPGYEHTFGHPLPEWVRMRDHIRILVRGGGQSSTPAQVDGS